MLVKFFIGGKYYLSGKLTGVNFINILQAALTLANPKSAKKKTNNLLAFYLLSGSAQVKAVHKMLVKLTPGVNFTNIFTLSFYACRS